jgi:hypothetical protein
MSVVRTLAAVGLVMLQLPSLGAEPTVTISIRDGRASVRARNASVSDVLAEWSRAGGTTIVNGEQLSGAHLTLDLVDVPEAQALDIVLRPAAGYVARKRPVALATASTFDRVVVLARSVVVVPEQRPIPQPSPRIVPQPSEPREPFYERLIGPDGLPVPDDDQDTVPPPPRDRGQAPAPSPTAAPATASPASAPPRSAVPAGVPVPGMMVPPPPAPSSPPQPQR